MPAVTTLECGMLVASIYLEMEHVPLCVNLTLLWFVVLIDFGFMVLVSMSYLYLHLQLQYAICNMQYAICNIHAYINTPCIVCKWFLCLAALSLVIEFTMSGSSAFAVSRCPLLVRVGVWCFVCLYLYCCWC
jgi:hypothetical protein